MANYQQAPTLKFNGVKSLGNNFYGIPQDLADIIFRELGNSSAQLRIMIVLIGTKEGFNISDKWICERTGLQHPSYITARKALVKRGWLTHEAAKGITVNIDAIYGRNCGNTTLPEEEKNCSNTTLPERSNTVLPQRGNMVLPEGSNMVLPITDKETDNKIDKLTDAQEQAPSQEEPEAEGTAQKPIIVSREWLIKRHNHIQTCANGLFYYNDKFYKMEG